ncbi:MAG: DUF4124 domain-containing protein [Chromatiales bacterium]
MKYRLMTKLTSPLVLTALLTFATAADAGKLYKWVDDEGNTHFSDHIPPKYSQDAHSRLNEKGITVEKKSAAKTAEEIQKEQELERLRKQQEEVIAKQRAKDRVLLKTFRSEDDLLLARDGKIRSVDNLITITHGNIRRLKAKLSEMQASAAAQEKAGQSVSKNTLKDIDSHKRQINEAYASIVKREETKEEIRQKFADDLTRFRTLKKIYQDEAEKTEVKLKNSELNTVFRCPDGDCESSWERGKEYVMQYATTKVQLIGDNILMTRAPRADEDISLTISRITDKDSGKKKLFLDLQCKRSIMGEELCEGPKVREIKLGFIPFVSAQ